MIYFAALESVYEMNFPFELVSFTYGLEFNGVSKYDQPDSFNPDSDNANPYDHSRHTE